MNPESSQPPEHDPIEDSQADDTAEQVQQPSLRMPHERTDFFQGFAKRLEAWADDAERTWTYRQVCAYVIWRLQDINTAEDTWQAVEHTRTSLAFCLRMAKACYERELAASESVTLRGVVEGLQHMLGRVERERRLSADSVRDAIDIMILELSVALS